MRLRYPSLAVLAFLTGITGAPAGLISKARAQQAVAIELVLATDTSISVNQQEYVLQMQGIASAFRDPGVIALIGSHPGGVAVTLVHWNVAHRNAQALPWTLLNDRNSILAFAQATANVARVNTGNATAIGAAIDYSVELIEQNAYQGVQRKIDISGDGRNNSGPSPEEARNRAIAKNITINGLSILNGDKNLYNHYESYVIGGPAAFVVAADEFEDFAEAMRIKLLRELLPPVS